MSPFETWGAILVAGIVGYMLRIAQECWHARPPRLRQSRSRGDLPPPRSIKVESPPPHYRCTTCFKTDFECRTLGCPLGRRSCPMELVG